MPLVFILTEEFFFMIFCRCMLEGCCRASGTSAFIVSDSQILELKGTSLVKHPRQFLVLSVQCDVRYTKRDRDRRDNHRFHLVRQRGLP